jgi:hypothetical protein
LKTGVLWITDKLGKTLSTKTLKRLLKSEGYVWKRMRRSLRKKRDEADFQAAKEHLDALRKGCAKPKSAFDLIYFDAAGFTLTPCIPYAWQEIGKTLELPSAHSQRLNVLGFLNLTGAFQPYVFEGRVDSAVIIECFNDYCQRMSQPCLVVLDNAPVHTSDEFKEQIKRWEEQGLYLLFIPPYCPELNLIEILWRKIKYEWLPLSAYLSFDHLQEALLDVLKNIGAKYRLSFV